MKIPFSHKTRQNGSNYVSKEEKNDNDLNAAAALPVTGQTEAKALFCGLRARHKY